MKFSVFFSWSIIALALLPGTIAVLNGCSEQTDSALVEETDLWHQGRLERLTAEDGWLTLVGLHPLEAGSHTLGSAPRSDIRLVAGAPEYLGDLTVVPGKVLLTVHPDVVATVQEDGQVNRVRNLSLVPDDPGPATVVTTGSLSFHVIRRGDRRFLRVKDRQSPVLRDFTGIDRFPVDSRWRVTARLTGGPTTIKVANALGQVEEAPSPGSLEFQLGGKEYQLSPQGEPGKGLFIVFADETSGKTTYPGGRFLSTDPPAADGTVVLDFNRATNPPCAFTPHATCPLPSLDNTLPVAVTAGEKIWGEKH
jgi:uncharacterized protein (DUF1684 family)